MINATAEGSGSISDALYDFVAGKPIKIALEYYQENTDGNPSVALLWSLLPSGSSDSITPAVEEISQV